MCSDLTHSASLLVTISSSFACRYTADNNTMVEITFGKSLLFFQIFRYWHMQTDSFQLLQESPEGGCEDVRV